MLQHILYLWIAKYRKFWINPIDRKGILPILYSFMLIDFVEPGS